MIMEIWKDIPNRQNYMVSNCGRVKSVDRYVPYGRGQFNKFIKGRILKAAHDKDGYLQLMLGADHPKGLSRKIHRLVMLAFKGHSNLEVNHKDGNKQNNKLNNLEYCTHSENHIHARYVLGKLIGKNHWYYKRNHNVV